MESIVINLYYDNFQSPLGLMEVTATAQAVKSIHFVDEVEPTNGNRITALTKQQLLAYFNG
ncbi:MAG: hypothetical protein ACJAQ6_001471, partial [Arenicella sp.]